MSALAKIFGLIMNVFQHPVYGPAARSVARTATLQLLRRLRTHTPAKSNTRVG
jgi:hypothetical protein